VLHAQGAASAPTAHRFRDVTISPDGKYLAWVGAPGTGATSSAASLVVMDRARGVSSALAVAIPGTRPGSAHALNWSRDGRTLVLLAAGADDGVTTVYAVPAGGGDPRVVARVPGSVRAPELSPDGTQIAVLYSAPE
jgi:dipeptidyl aminopeptidase/acylaminoacyl peptidase